MSVQGIDPRIRARRIEVQRDEGRRRLRRLAVAAGGATVVAAAWGVTRTPLLDVDHIDVRGAARTGTTAVQQATGIDRGDPLLSSAVGRAADAVAELPWVLRAEVARRWPNTIEVRVIERTPAAAVPVAAGGWVLLDVTGRQLAVVPEVLPGVPRVEIPPVARPTPGALLESDADAVLRLAATRPASLQDRLVALRPSADGAVEGTVRLRGDATAIVRFGQPTLAAAKWLALLTVLEDADPAGLRAIDVRVPSAPALTRR